MDLERLKANLEKRGFAFRYFETGGEVADYICSQLHGTTVGIGGSRTVDTIGVYDRLCQDNQVYWHWKQDPDMARANALVAKTYICSANGIAETGEIINIDGACNRLAACMYDKERVFIVAGVNKVEKDYDSALWRARNIAAPLNARRFNVDTPCVKGDLRCYDCSSPERICRALQVLWKKPMSVEQMEVLLINEELGY